MKSISKISKYFEMDDLQTDVLAIIDMLSNGNVFTRIIKTITIIFFNLHFELILVITDDIHNEKKGVCCKKIYSIKTIIVVFLLY